jgi:hemolysin activation/secretion protein
LLLVRPVITAYFSDEDLAEVTKPFTGEVTFAELLEAEAAVTKHYTDAGYINSGAVIPAGQNIQSQDGVVKMQIIEGEVEAIAVTGTRQLNQNYVRSRLAIAKREVLRSDLQFSTRALVPLEQFSLGGLQSVRGYRQDALLTDNGFFASAEVRLPILRVEKLEGVLQVVPFVDFGIGWNSSDNPDPDPNSLVGVGLGLQCQVGNLTRRQKGLQRR